MEAAKFIKDIENFKCDRFCEWFAKGLGFESDINYHNHLQLAEKEIVQHRRSHARNKDKGKIKDMNFGRPTLQLVLTKEMAVTLSEFQNQKFKIYVETFRIVR